VTEGRWGLGKMKWMKNLIKPFCLKINAGENKINFNADLPKGSWLSINFGKDMKAPDSIRFSVDGEG